ncbi:MAG: GNAT family N-acetyltransferase, partial [Octadecabacter sp.]
MTLPLSLPLQQSPPFAAALAALGVPLSSHDPVVLQRRIPLLGRVGFTSRGPLDTRDMRGLRRDGLRVFNGEHDLPAVYKS